MAVFSADPPRRVDRRLAQHAAQRDRRRPWGDSGTRDVGSQIRARSAVRFIRPLAHPRRRQRGGRGHPERQRPVADRDGRPTARGGARGGGGHSDRRRPDASGRRRRHPRILSARWVVPDRAAGRPVQLRAARPRREARRRARRATTDSGGHRRAAWPPARRGVTHSRSACGIGAPGLDVPGVRPRRGHQRRLRAARPIRGHRREPSLLARLCHGGVRHAEAGR